MDKKAVLIGNSDGIGFGLTKELLKRGWRVKGISKSASSIENELYSHKILDVSSGEYINALRELFNDTGVPDICIYLAGIGELFDVNDMEKDMCVFEVNLMGMVKTASVVLPLMAEAGKGHLIGLSSLADEMLSAEAPSYHASKAGFSSYMESLALALKETNVSVTNIRFGFVDTKMAKGDVKPFMMSVDRAVRHIMKCIDSRPARYTAPALAVPLVILLGFMLKLRLRFLD
jgi:short-subunit dehydrogenase